MTKVLLTLLGILCNLIVINANGQISFGLNSGLNLTTLSNETIEEDRWDKGIGYRIGGFSEKAFGKFGLRIEADYSFVGIKGLFDDRIGIHYISIPVTLFYRPFERLKIFVGPEVNFLLGQNGPKYQLAFGEEDFEKIDYGAHVEIEFIITRRLGISARNYFGLQFNGEISAAGPSPSSKLNRLNILGLGVNYYLINRKE